jgi:RNA polymerase sigma-70 factor (subfamily 1)
MPLGDQAERLIAAARQDSSEALGQLLQAYQGLLLAEANDLLPNSLRAKAGPSDLVQSAFVKARRDFHQFRGTSEAEFRGWLTQILDHTVSNFKRDFDALKRDLARECPPTSSPHGATGQLVSDGPSPSGLVSQQEEAALVRSAVRQLSPEDQRVITFRHFAGASWDEVAAELGTSAEAARKRFARAVEKLQVLLESLRPSTECEEGERS